MLLVSCSQVQVRNKQAEQNSHNITRSVRVVNGRIPTVDAGDDSVLHWKVKTAAMKEGMSAQVFAPFKTALDKALLVHNSSKEYFVKQATTLLHRRRLFKNSAASSTAPATDFDVLMTKVSHHMIDGSQLSLQDVANFELSLFFTSCLMGTATLRDQTYRSNLLSEVYMNESGLVCESIARPLQLKVQAKECESGLLLVADTKPADCTLNWLMMIFAVRPMRVMLHSTPPSELIWGMAGSSNELVSKSAWSKQIQTISKAWLGSPRTGTTYYW
jgi:hypothetical protein